MIVCDICKKNPRRKIMVKDVIYDKTKSPGTRFIVYDEPVRLRGVVCRRYRCQDCNADYFVVAEPVLV